MKRMHPRLVRILVFLALVAAAAFGGHGKDWFP
jgi:hypothetical protein